MPKRPRSPADTDSPEKSKKLKLLKAYSSNSPFPTFLHPTPTEAKEVHALLSSLAPVVPSSKDNDVLECLISTILDQSTTAANSARAKNTLDTTFGRRNWAAIAHAPRSDVVEAIRQGGLANKKAKVIQEVFAEVYTRHKSYSLQHLSSTPADDTNNDVQAMEELVSLPGVGPKTAACVLMFSLGRQVFAVDTHVFRLSKLLGWVPPSADRVMAQAHLDAQIPRDLKWGLHVGMVKHGRLCSGCKGGVRKNKSGDENCILKKWIKERRETKDEEVEGGEASIKKER